MRLISPKNDGKRTRFDIYKERNREEERDTKSERENLFENLNQNGFLSQKYFALYDRISL